GRDHPRHRGGRDSSDRQPSRAGSGRRVRLRPGHGAGHGDRLRDLELVRLRWSERHARVSPVMSAARTRRVAITGVGTVNAAFVGRSPELSSYLAHPENRVRAERSAESSDESLVAPVDDRALDGLIDTAEERRVSRISRFAIAAARLALTDAGLEAHDLSLVVGPELGDLKSTKEFANGCLERGPTGLSALLFPSTVMNTMAAATAIAVQARAAALTLNAPVVAGELAVARAAAGIAAGRFEAA